MNLYKLKRLDVWKKKAVRIMKFIKIFSLENYTFFGVKICQYVLFWTHVIVRNKTIIKDEPIEIKKRLNVWRKKTVRIINIFRIICIKNHAFWNIARSQYWMFLTHVTMRSKTKFIKIWLLKDICDHNIFFLLAKRYIFHDILFKLLHQFNTNLNQNIIN